MGVSYFEDEPGDRSTGCRVGRGVKYGVHLRLDVLIKGSIGSETGTVKYMDVTEIGRPGGPLKGKYGV